MIIGHVGKLEYNLDKRQSKLIMDFMRLCRDVLNSGDGKGPDHFWLDLQGYGITEKKLYITGEADVEDGEIYLFCYLIDGVDSMGYAYGNIILDAYPDLSNNDAELSHYAEYLLSGIGLVEQQEAAE